MELSLFFYKREDVSDTGINFESRGKQRCNNFVGGKGRRFHYNKECRL